MLKLALALLNSHTVERFRSRIADWARSAIGSRVRLNLEIESILAPVRLADLTEAIAAAHSSPDHELESEYELRCHAHALEGGEVLADPFPTMLGRAVERRWLIGHLVVNHLSEFGTKAEVERFVDRITGLHGASITKAEAKVLMSRFPAWCTWDDEKPDGDPFSFATSGRADEVRASLGLVSPRKGRSAYLVLLVYRQVAFNPLKRPTVADAALYPHFRPARPVVPGGEIPHGWSLPWPTEETDLLLPGVRVKSHPEAVHQPQVFGALQTSMTRLVT